MSYHEQTCGDCQHFYEKLVESKDTHSLHFVFCRKYPPHPRSNSCSYPKISFGMLACSKFELKNKVPKTRIGARKLLGREIYSIMQVAQGGLIIDSATVICSKCGKGVANIHCSDAIGTMVLKVADGCPSCEKEASNEGDN